MCEVVIYQWVIQQHWAAPIIGPGVGRQETPWELFPRLYQAGLLISSVPVHYFFNIFILINKIKFKIKQYLFLINNIFVFNK